MDQSRRFGVLFCLGVLSSLCSETVVTAQTWSPTDSLGISHGFHTATMLGNGKVLVAGGIEIWAASGRTRICELYDPTTDTWSNTGQMVLRRQDHVATRLADGLVLVSGGMDPASLFLTDCELYDPGTELWSSTGGMNSRRARHSATLLPDGTVLACGGVIAGFATADATDTCDIYDPAMGTWSPTNAMSTERLGHTGTLLNDGTVLVCGGFGDDAVAIGTCELYDAGTGTWSPTGTLNVARGGAEMRNFTATLLSNGKLLVTGGSPGPGGEAIKSCELYDSGTWLLTGDMAEGRSVHSATLLENGEVLVAGGGGAPQFKASCELYDPATGIWRTAPSMDTARLGHTATLLGNGKVLAVGGTIGPFTLTPLCELYESSSIPTVSEWGLVVMTLLVLAAGTVVLMRRRRSVV